MIAVGDGDLWLLSTPAGKRGFFYEAWAHGDEWERHTAPATQCPRIRPSFLEEERRAMGEAWFAQEYLCEFSDDGGHLSPPPRRGRPLRRRTPLSMTTYSIGVDLGQAVADGGASGLAETVILFGLRGLHCRLRRRRLFGAGHVGGDAEWPLVGVGARHVDQRFHAALDGTLAGHRARSS